MEFIDRIVGELRDAFQYFKERSKSKYYGDRFEEWVVKNSNIIKNESSDSNNDKSFWRLLEWRGDKYVEGYRALSSSSPDLLLECINSSCEKMYRPGNIIAVECKWRSNMTFYLEPHNIQKYEQFIASNKLNAPVKGLFYVFGFGWSSGNPAFVYVIPAKELYDYDQDSRFIKFLKGKTEDKAKLLEKYKLDRSKKESKYLMYRMES